MNIRITCGRVKKNFSQLPKYTALSILKMCTKKLNSVKINFWQKQLRRGIRHLSGHEPAKAIPCFERALASCPETRGKDLSRLLYYQGMALKRLGYENSAIRSWVDARKAWKKKEIRRLLGCCANSYGMAKQDCAERDDWQAFYALQQARYLTRLNRRTLASRSEQALLKTLIYSYWINLKNSGLLEGCSEARKRALFKSYTIDFPFVSSHSLGEPVIRVNFRTGRKMEGGETCFCGSGLAYRCCCGRTSGVDEQQFGLF